LPIIKSINHLLCKHMSQGQTTLWISLKWNSLYFFEPHPKDLLEDANHFIYRGLPSVLLLNDISNLVGAPNI
jgi:hypothetical protein